MIVMIVKKVMIVMIGMKGIKLKVKIIISSGVVEWLSSRI